MSLTSQLCGIGLRFKHIDEILQSRPNIPWMEILSDNYLIQGSVQQEYLYEVAKGYPLSMHGVGMSLGSVDPLNTNYLKRIKALAEIINPIRISDHLCWSSAHGISTYDLIPLPYNQTTIDHVVGRICRVQDFLGRELVIENVSSYLQYKDSAMPEWAFLSHIVEAADCGILLDINNIYVSAQNHGFSAEEYIRSVPVERVRQFHVGGHEDHGSHLLDTHGQAVQTPVWNLLGVALKQIGLVPTLVEWDNNVPELDVLLSEAEKANNILAQNAKTFS